MSQHETFRLDHLAPARIDETVTIDESVSHIDILLLSHQETWRDGMRWVDAVRKALRLSRIDERSLVMTDLSSLSGDHRYDAPPAGSEFGLPYDVMDLYDDESQLFGRNHNPADLPILANELVSREHFTITPHLGEAGLRLAIQDTHSVNGSSLGVHHHAEEYARL